jgi:L-alanine-DL-glutamate epimerase-like enolase superfamily enzyme
MKITSVQTTVLEVPLDKPIQDSRVCVDKWGVVAVQIHTDEGVIGMGYNSNIGVGGLSAKTLIDRDIAPAIVGKDVFLLKKVWQEAYLDTHFTGITGIAVQGLAAVEVAMWDAVAKCLEQPLWKILGGYESTRLPTYSTDAGWLSLTLDELGTKTKKLVDQGWQGLKMKVGKPDLAEDYARVKTVRNAIGPDIRLMVDANCKWDLPTAIRAAKRLEEFDLFWIEEPVHPFDVNAHVRLSECVNTNIMAGENIYSLHMWRDFIYRNAVSIVQADSLKLGGISTWLEVAALAHASSLPVVPAVWDMMQLNVHLGAAIPNVLMIEYIPWILQIFVHPVKFVDGHLLVPQEPGAGTEIKKEALEKFRVA